MLLFIIPAITLEVIKHHHTDGSLQSPTCVRLPTAYAAPGPDTSSPRIASELGRKFVIIGSDAAAFAGIQYVGVMERKNHRPTECSLSLLHHAATESMRCIVVQRHTVFSASISRSRTGEASPQR